jgi:hypothetical protein
VGAASIAVIILGHVSAGIGTRRRHRDARNLHWRRRVRASVILDTSPARIVRTVDFIYVAAMKGDVAAITMRAAFAALARRFVRSSC